MVALKYLPNSNICGNVYLTNFRFSLVCGISDIKNYLIIINLIVIKIIII